MGDTNLGAWLAIGSVLVVGTALCVAATVAPFVGAFVAPFVGAV